jgi:hypothetical protein
MCQCIGFARQQDGFQASNSFAVDTSPVRLGGRFQLIVNILRNALKSDGGRHIAPSIGSILVPKWVYVNQAFVTVMFFTDENAAML